jgi:hypothetical protein
MTAQPATILGSEVHTMTSERSGRTYRVTVSLPLGYAAQPGERWPFNAIPDKWPTVYVLDGNWYDGMVAGIIRPMALCGATTDAIVVGIGYPEGDDPIEAFRTSFTRRDHDLTPVPDPATQRQMEGQHGGNVPNGDASGFLAFIQGELVPFIETNYRADPADRILVGHSYGGLFAAYALFEAPDLFQTHIMGSPTLTYGDRWMFTRETEFAQANKRLPATVYLFAGEYEEDAEDTTVTDTLRFAALLGSRKYEGFSLTKHIFAGQNHCAVAAPGIQAGLKLALKK